MKHTLIILLGTLLIFACKAKTDSPTDQEAVKELTASEQLNEIMTMWPGSYTNINQITAAEKQGKAIWRTDDSGEGGYLHITSHYIKLEKPDIGDNVLYVEEYRDDIPSETYRQRIYTLSVDDSLGVVAVKMWPFKDKEKYIGAYNNLSMLDDLTKEGISAFPDICDLRVTREGDKYNMSMNGKDCTFGTKTFNYQVMLSDDIFSYRDKITDTVTDTIITTAADYIYHDLDRIN